MVYFTINRPVLHLPIPIVYHNTSMRLKAWHRQVGGAYFKFSSMSRWEISDKELALNIEEALIKVLEPVNKYKARTDYIITSEINKSHTNAISIS